MSKQEHDKILSALRDSLQRNLGQTLTDELATGINVVVTSKLEGMVEVSDDDLSSQK